jgi:hypothetical protein
MEWKHAAQDLLDIAEEEQRSDLPSTSPKLNDAEKPGKVLDDHDDGIPARCYQRCFIRLDAMYDDAVRWFLTHWMCASSHRVCMSCSLLRLAKQAKALQIQDRDHHHEPNQKKLAEKREAEDYDHGQVMIARTTSSGLSM